jgi:hypothetical protein
VGGPFGGGTALAALENDATTRTTANRIDGFSYPFTFYIQEALSMTYRSARKAAKFQNCFLISIMTL